LQNPLGRRNNPYMVRKMLRGMVKKILYNWYDGNITGIWWEYNGNMMGISWDYNDNIYIYTTNWDSLGIQFG
jgi:hypothetical protein